MRLLCVCYMLPPALYPQAIQIGRLLMHTDGEIGVVCGTSSQRGDLDRGIELDRRLAFRLAVPFQPRLRGTTASLARHLLPLYARIPDEFRAWVPLAEAATTAHLARSQFAPDLLVTFGEPMSDHLLGLRLKSRLGLPWIAHFSDPWVDSSFRRRNPIANIVNRRLERSVVARAERVIFTSEETRDLVMAKYPPAWREKTAIIPHSFDPRLFPQAPPPDETLVVRHVGHFYGHRSPIPLFRALALLLATDPGSLSGVRFELVGQLPWRFRRHPSLRRLPHGLVHLVGHVPYSRSLALMSSSDLLLTIDGADECSVFLPSKLIEYLGSGVPVLGIVPPGTSARLLARCGGLVADPREPNAIARALLRMLQLARERRRLPAREPWVGPTISGEFHAERVAARFSGLLRDSLRPHSSQPGSADHA